MAKGFSKKGKLELKRFSWDGVSLRIPPDWELGAISKSEKSTYIRLDDEENIRAEIRWSRTKKRLDIDKSLLNYLSTLRKEAKKEGKHFESEEGIRLLSDKEIGDEREIRTFRWESGGQAYGFVMYCNVCRKSTIVQLFYPADRTYKSQASQILKTFEDHPRGDMVPWSLYGLAFWVPAKYELENYDLQSGHIRFLFRYGKKRLEVERWSMANVLLKGKGLERWWSEIVDMKERDMVYDLEPRVMKGHSEAFVMRSKGRKLRLHLPPFMSRRPRYYRNWDSLVWHCEDDNKIFTVGWTKDGEIERDAELVADMMECHAPAGSGGGDAPKG